jgi:FkbM family methyltransferase
MAGLSGAAKEWAKRWVRPWVRPVLIPIVRPCVRYAPHDSIRKAAWYIFAPFLHGAKHTFVARTQFGVAISGDLEDVIQRYIYYFGVWEPNLTEFLRTRLREGDVFVDVGANIGYFTLQASTLVGRTGRVIAIEASPTIFRKLQANLERNHVQNVDALNVAACDHNGSVQVYLARPSNLGKTNILANEGSRYEGDVAASSLDMLLSPAQVARIRLLKIDVEGAEWLVVDGMRNLLRQARPNLEVVVELRPQVLRQYGKDVDDFVGLFAELGYKPYRLENDYSALSHMSRGNLKHPLRIKSPISTQTDIVFSKTDAEYL